MPPTYVILVDLRGNNGHVVAITDDNGNVAQFPTRAAALEAMRDHILGAFPTRVVQL